MYNSDFAVQQKLTQPCKSTILQLKKKKAHVTMKKTKELVQKEGQL